MQPPRLIHLASQAGRRACLVVCLSFTLLTATAAGQQITFSNVAAAMGINYTYSGQFLGGGVSFCDFDMDGVEDLSLTSGPGEAVYVLANSGNSFDDITAQLGLTDRFESETILWADYDNDGDRDLFIINFFGSDKLYRNDGPNGFVDYSGAAGILPDSFPSTAAALADVDNDGWLDLYVANYSFINGSGDVTNILYHNNGDGTFSDVSAAMGVGDPGKQPLAVVFLDYNGDGWPDIYIANDKRNGNTLFRNEAGGGFTNVSAASGTDLHFDAMGLAVADYDTDGDFDIYVSNGEEGNGLLRNNGDGTFAEVADSLGVAVRRVCWGTSFLDIDNDGDLDLYVSVSHGNPDRENALFENLGDGSFVRTTGRMLGGDAGQSYGNAVADYNNDGYPDIAVMNVVDPFMLWKNSGGSNHWLKVRLQGTISNREGVGSIIEAYRNGERRIYSTHCGSSYLSQSSAEQIIGLGSSSVLDYLVVRWPGGMVDVIPNVPAGQTITVVENSGRMNNFAPFVGIQHSYEQRVENSIGGGAAFGDFDGDGWEDLAVATGDGEHLALFRNEDGRFINVADSAGIITEAEAKTVLWGDADNDGDPDLFVANFNAGNVLYLNEGNGLFSDITLSAGLADTSQSTAAAWVDYDNDGWLDLYVSNYGNVNGAGDQPNYLYRNNGDLTFSDVTQQAGLAGGVNKKPLALAFFDYDNDGWQDLYICNDKEQGNLLYHNNGDGTFSDVTAASGTGARMDAMGISVADYNRDGYQDFYISNGTQGNVFYRNNGDGTFTDVAPQLGMTVNRECWGNNFADFDNDGWVDLFVTVADGANREDVLFQGGTGGFTDVSHAVGIADHSLGYGSAVADFDGDGGLDIFVVNRQFAGGEKSFLYRNSLQRGNWLQVKTIGSVSNRDGIGARVRVVCALSPSPGQIQEVRAGSSYLSQNSRTLSFGLAAATTADSLIVEWPAGGRTVLTQVAANQTVVVTENPTAVEPGSPRPGDFVLRQNYPNPFNPQTTITFVLPVAAQISLRIYDILGREVRTLLAGRQPAGLHSVVWDGRDRFGAAVASGLYLYQLQIADRSQSRPQQVATRKMLLLK